MNEDEHEDLLSNDDEHPPELMNFTPPHPHRSSAPTPNNPIGQRIYFPPDEDEVSDISGGGGSLFVSSTPRVIESISIRSGEAEKRGSMNTEVPLLGPNEDSRLLETLTLWGKIPNSGTRDDMIKRGAGRENTDLVERWRGTFYKFREEWNRDWKRRRREGEKRGVGKTVSA